MDGNRCSKGIVLLPKIITVINIENFLQFVKGGYVEIFNFLYF